MRPRVLTAAQDEWLEAMLRYEDRRAGLGEIFLNRVTETIQTIGKSPLRFPVYEGQKSSRRKFRRARVPRFPYIVVYEVLAEETVVIAVAHTSRRPGYWRRRKS